MVAAVHFLATDEDESALLDHLGEPHEVSLHTWPLVHVELPALPRTEILGVSRLMVVGRALGDPVLVAAPADDPDDLPASGILARFRRTPPAPPRRSVGLVDSNTSPVLLWQRGATGPAEFTVSDIGSQADAMDRIHDDYRRWVNRTMSWVRRRGTKVWGLEQAEVRPDLDIDLPIVSTIFALPGALDRLHNGARAR